MKSSVRYPIGKAFTIIALSTLLISGSACLGLLYFSQIYGMRMGDNQYRIVAIVQTGPQKEALQTVYLAELLGLSVDEPANLYRFHVKSAEAKLLASPLIKAAEVKKIKPGVLYIDYEMREPVAFLGDYSNTAIDAEGVLFPVQPYFTPKNFPEIYLGLFENEDSTSDKPVFELKWGTKLQGERLALALEVLQLVSSECCSAGTHIKRVDVSRAYASSYGQKQIVVMLEDQEEHMQEGKSILCFRPRLVRLNVDSYKEGLQRYRLLHEYLVKQEAEKPVATTSSIYKGGATIVDLRIPHLAFVKNGEETQSSVPVKAKSVSTASSEVKKT